MDKKIANELLKQWEEMGDSHISVKQETPLREDAFEMDDDLKIELIEKHFREIMHIMGLDLTDDSLKGTPHRVAKMYVKEVFSGLNPKNKPLAKLFENKYKYNEMLVEKDITFHSHCEHHFVPIYGKAHVAYISNGTVVEVLAEGGVKANSNPADAAVIWFDRAEKRKLKIISTNKFEAWSLKEFPVIVVQSEIQF